jgi:GT2 family glycosyltransferase
MVKSSNPKVGVILLTMNQKEKTIRCLKSFKAVISPTYKIVLWDNGSQDGTSDVVRKEFPDVLVHHHPQNAGVATGRNEAAKIAITNYNPDYLFILDNDMTVTPGFLDALLKPFESDPRLALTTGKIKDINNHERLYGAGGCRIRFWLGDTGHVGYGEIDRGQYDKRIRCIPSGGCILVRRDVFQQLGGFDNNFDPYGFQDLDFGLRAVKAGYYGLFVPQAVVFHESRRSGTFEGRQYTEKYAFTRARNWFIFMNRHASVMQKFGFFFVGAPYLLMILMVREAKNGNLIVALKGLARGALNFMSLSLQGKK